MRILEDGSDEEAHEFVVELEIVDARGSALRELWESALDKGDYGGPYAIVRCEGGKGAPSAVRASLRRFNQPPDDGWRWSTEALAAYLLNDLCGVVLLGWPIRRTATFVRTARPTRQTATSRGGLEASASPASRQAGRTSRMRGPSKGRTPAGRKGRPPIRHADGRSCPAPSQYSRSPGGARAGA